MSDLATQQDPFDILVIGGGINGCGIARDAAGRGCSVLLAEQADLASGTSSASTKLIHGGLRYLEQYEFTLVRKALIEREVLWAIAPHIIRPLRFVLPHHARLRPAWLLRLGLFLYDHLGGRRLLPPTRVLDLSTDEAGLILAPHLRGTGFEYSDGWVEDARLVVLNAMDAARLGADIRTRCRVVAAHREDGLWRVTLDDKGVAREVTARALVNAAGPWVEGVLGLCIAERTPTPVRLVQGSHIIVPRLFDHGRCYIFQNADGRVLFAIPYEHDFTLIGTTDHDFTGDPAQVFAGEDEIGYLLGAINGCLARPVRRADVVASYAGVRALTDDGSGDARAASRDYVLALDAEGPPFLSVIGGKITTYRKLAEEALGKLLPHLPARTGHVAGWTGHEPLPGGDFAVDGRAALAARLHAAYPFITPAHAARLAGSYGTLSFAVLGDARSMADLGEVFGADLTACELEYLYAHEWARTAQDALWRRSKLMLHLDAAAIARVEAWFAVR